MLNLFPSERYRKGKRIFLCCTGLAKILKTLRKMEFELGIKVIKS